MHIGSSDYGQQSICAKKHVVFHVEGEIMQMSWQTVNYKVKVV